MPIRLVLCKIVEHVVPAGTIYVDPETGEEEVLEESRHKGPVFDHTVITAPKVQRWRAIVAGDTVGIFEVESSSLAALDQVPGVFYIFDEDEPMTFRNFLTELQPSPRARGWNTGKWNQVQNLMNRKGVDTTGLTIDTPVNEILQRVREAISAGVLDPEA